MKKFKNPILFLGVFLAPVALKLAYLTASSVCFFLSYQPDEPDSLRKMNAHRSRKDK